MTTRKWVLVLFVLVITGFGYTVLRRIVDRNQVMLIIYLVGITILGGILFLQHIRRQQIPSATILLTTKYKENILVGVFSAGIVTFIGLGIILDHVGNLREVNLLEIATNIAMIIVFWLSVFVNQGHMSLTQNGLLTGVFYFQWHKIHSYRWKENRLELHTGSFFSPHLVTIDPQRKNEVDAVLYQLTGKNPSES